MRHYNGIVGRRRLWIIVGTALVLAGSAFAPQRVDPGRLGKLRASFGEPQNIPQKFERAVFTGTTGSLEEFFPAGRADRRYRLDTGSGGGDWLVLLVKSRGKVRVEWVAELGRLPSAKSRSALGSLGTLARHLAMRLYEVKPPVARSVRDSLSARKPFAWYTYDWHLDQLSFDFISLDGSASGQVRYVDRSQVGSNSAYPITPEEKEILRKSRPSGRRS